MVIMDFIPRSQVLKKKISFHSPYGCGLPLFKEDMVILNEVQI